MATTTIRLDEAEETTLDHLAELHGGRSNALREGLRLLASLTQKRERLAQLLDDWAAESNPVEDDAMQAMVDQYRL